jgi:hypothetical protein
MLLNVCTYVCMNVCMYIQYIQGLCQSRLSTVNHALLLISPATMAVYSLERSYAWPPPSLSLLYFLCRGSPCPMLRTFLFSCRICYKHLAPTTHRKHSPSIAAWRHTSSPTRQPIGPLAAAQQRDINTRRRKPSLFCCVMRGITWSPLPLYCCATRALERAQRFVAQRCLEQIRHNI